MNTHLSWPLFICILLFTACTSPGNEKPYATEQSTPAMAYSDETSCSQCHQEQHTEWEASHHAKAMQPANESTVLANFNTTFSADGVTYVFHEEHGKFWVNIQEKNKPEQRYEVVHTFGYTPLQQYLLSFPHGKLQVLRASWDTENKKWFHQYEGEEIHATHNVHYSKQSQNWNSMCSSCHSTHVEKNYFPAVDSFHTTMQFPTVGCQSCHGPMQAHVNYRSGTSSVPAPASYTHAKNDVQATNMCGTCHSRRTMLADYGDVDSVFLNHYMPQSLNTSFYEPDGQIMEEDFVYASFISSKMHANHVTCKNCHSPHSGELKASGNQLCLQCHAPSYATEKHTHHSDASTGSQCINCHMDGKTYMGNDYRRDHSFRVPRPHQSVQFGTSNACTSCHTDQSNKWAATHTKSWFGTPDTTHYTDDLIKVSLQDEHSLFFAQRLVADTGVPAIIQATAVDYIGNMNSRAAMQFVEANTQHSAPLVQLQAYTELMPFPPSIKLAYAPKALKSPTRAIRIIGYRLANGYAQQLSTPAKKQFQQVESEYKQFLAGISDFANGQILWGEFYSGKNQMELAKKHYQWALKIDSLQPTAYSNLIVINSKQQKNEAVSHWIETGIRHFPEYPEFYYFQGLYYSELGQYSFQLKALKRAYDLGPTNPKYGYNYALTEMQYGNPATAKALIAHLIREFPADPKIAQLKVYL